MPMTREPLGVAVVGAGYWGPNLVRNVLASPEFRLRWVCDVDVDRARRVAGRFSDTLVTDTLEDVLTDSQTDAVIVATPVATHFPIAAAALRAGKHVLVEKPLAASYDDAAILVAMAIERGLVLMCDHTYCYTPAVRKMRDIIASGTLGDVQYLDSVRINLGLVQRDVDVIWDLAPHDLSIMDFVFPAEVRPISVAAHGADPIGAGRACLAYLSLALPGGGLAHIHVNWLSPVKIRTMLIGGSRRILLWDDLNPVTRIALFDRGVDLRATTELDGDQRRDALVSYRAGDMVAPALVEREALGEVVSEFAAAIREGRPALTDGMSGLRVLDILEAASRSLECGGAPVALRDGRTREPVPAAAAGAAEPEDSGDAPRTSADPAAYGGRERLL
jgi:predicted dehydrogenase